MKLKICSWNIAFAKNLDTILKQIKTEPLFRDIDILALQEASIHNNLEDSSVISIELGKHYSYSQVYAQISKNKQQANSIIWNNKKFRSPFISSIKLPRYSDVELNKIENLIKNFLPKENRNAVIFESKLEEKKIRIYNAHFDLIGYEHKRNQLKHIFDDDTKKSKTDLSIILGDINTLSVFNHPKYHDLRSLSESYKFKELSDKLSWTFKLSSFGIKQNLDKAYLKTNLKYKNKTYAKNLPGSDHIPVFIEINTL